ncbi:MAG: hypothetical protein ACI3XA_06160 [Clostridia bacterium]
MKRLAASLTALVLVFAFIAFGVTNWCINQKNSTPIEQTIDLDATYDQNDLLVDKIIEVYNGTEVEIPQIKGLKDTAIQDKINNDIYQRATKAFLEFEKIDYSSYYTYGNFANVISISLYIGGDSLYNQVDFNYNLVDGSPLQLEDLFVKDADIISVVRSAFYDTLAFSDFFDSMDYEGFDYEEYLASPDENQLYKLVKSYMNGDKEFIFSPSAIYLSPSNYMAEVSMVDIYDKVAIYSKYMTEESIFTGEYKGFKNIFTCADAHYEMFDKIEYGYIEENMWYDITVWQDYIDDDINNYQSQKYKSFRESIYLQCHDILEEYRLSAKSNPDYFHILLMKPNITLYSKSEHVNGEWINHYSDMATVNNSIQFFQMPMELYESVYKNKIIDAYRNRYFSMAGGVYLDTEETEGATVMTADDTKLYNYITKEPLTSLEDVFYPDSNYMDIIEDEIISQLAESGYFGYDVSDAVITLNGDSIIATIPNIDDFYVYISFYRFDKESFKLFD